MSEGSVHRLFYLYGFSLTPVPPKISQYSCEASFVVLKVRCGCATQAIAGRLRGERVLVMF